MAITREEARVIYQALATYQLEWLEADAIANNEDAEHVFAVVDGLLSRLEE